MSQEVSRWLGKWVITYLYINGVYWSYDLLTNLFVTSLDIQVVEQLSVALASPRSCGFMFFSPVSGLQTPMN